MAKVQDPYSRVYWKAIDDPKFAGIWDVDSCLAAWVRLLLHADMAWPASASLYHGLKKAALEKLVEVGLVDLVGGGRYRIHGLDKERETRSQQAREAINTRWRGHTGVIPPYPGEEYDRTTDEIRAYPMSSTEGIPSQAEPSKAETRRADSPPTPAKRGLRSNGTNPRAMAAQDEQRRRDRATRLQQRYLRGEITEAEYVAGGGDDQWDFGS